MPDYGSFRLGGLTSPLELSGSNTLLRDADPALYWFTEWCRGVIQAHCGARWDTEVAEAGLSDLNGRIVRATIPYDPVPHFQLAQYQLPILAIYRTESDFNDATTTWIRRVGIWELDYILPPLGPSQLERLHPMLSVIEAVLYDRINQDFDPLVLSGQRLKDLMGTEYIKLLAARPSRDWLKTTSSQAGGTNSVLFPLLHMRLEVAERKMPDTYPAWTGVDGTTDVGTVTVAEWKKDNP